MTPQYWRGFCIICFFGNLYWKIKLILLKILKNCKTPKNEHSK
jgi:hypothetical protein